MPEASEEADDVVEVGSDAAAAALGAVIGLPMGPIGSVVGAAAGPGLARGLRALGDHYVSRRRVRAERLIKLAARLAGIEPDVLVRRLCGSPELEDLFVRTFRAAAEDSAERKLVALARSLSASVAGGTSQIERETLFVRAIAELDEVHIDVLDQFTWTSNALGLGDGSSEFDTSLPALNSAQVHMAMPELEDIIDSILATLVRQGLLSYSTPTLPAFGGGPSISQWALSPFGRLVLDRLAVIREVLETP
jgi:hypothetical protein